MDSPETLFLPYDSLLEHIASPLDRAETEQIFAYSSFAVKKMLKKRDKAYGKLKLSVYEGIFTGFQSVYDITRKKYKGADERRIRNLLSCVLIEEILKGKPVFFFPIEETESDGAHLNYSLLSPVRLNIQIEDGRGDIIPESHLRSYPLLTFLIGRKQKEMRYKVGAAAMKLSKSELAFITRFNEETFFKNVPVQPIIELGLAENKDIVSFAALYSMAFYGLSFRDIYTVDEVFSFSSPDIRSKDRAKNQAAMELSEALETSELRKKAELIEKMGEALFELPLPEIDSKNMLALAENYIFYTAAADIGSAYSLAAEALSGKLSAAVSAKREKIKERAVLLSDYRHASALCEEMSAWVETGRTSAPRTKSRKKAEALRKRTEAARGTDL